MTAENNNNSKPATPQGKNTAHMLTNRDIPKRISVVSLVARLHALNKNIPDDITRNNIQEKSIITASDYKLWK